MNVKVKVWRSMSKRQRYLLLLAIATYQKQKRAEGAECDTLCLI